MRRGIGLGLGFNELRHGSLKDFFCARKKFGPGVSGFGFGFRFGFGFGGVLGGRVRGLVELVCRF